MIFKIGDKVKILPSASQDGIHRDDLDREAIVEDNHNYNSMYIRMVSPRLNDNGGWWVRGEYLEPAIKVGQQLLLWEWA